MYKLHLFFDIVKEYLTIHGTGSYYIGIGGVEVEAKNFERTLKN